MQMKTYGSKKEPFRQAADENNLMISLKKKIRIALIIRNAK